VSILRDGLGRVQEHILQAGCFLIFAADRKVGAAGSLGSLFALKAKHGVIPFFVFGLVALMTIAPPAVV